MIEISERRKLKTFSLLQGCEMVDGNTSVRRQYPFFVSVKVVA